LIKGYDGRRCPFPPDPPFYVTVMGSVTASANWRVGPVSINQVPIGPIVRIRAEAVLGSTSCALNGTNRRAHTRVDSRDDVQTGTQQYVVATDLRLAELDATGDEGIAAKAHDQPNAVELLGARARQPGVSDSQCQ